MNRKSRRARKLKSLVKRSGEIVSSIKLIPTPEEFDALTPFEQILLIKKIDPTFDINKLKELYKNGKNQN